MNVLLRRGTTMRNSCLTRPPARIQTHRPATAWEMPGCVRTSLGWHSSWSPWDGQHAWRQENWVAYSAKNPHSHSLQPADKGDLSEQGHSSVQNSRGALGKACKVLRSSVDCAGTVHWRYCSGSLSSYAHQGGLMVIHLVHRYWNLET